jgi:hypothetical protein
MNIQKLRQIIRLVPMVHDINQGPEFLFTQKVKCILPKTNFELLGEQLVVGKDNGIGKCDLWLANVPNKFLVSLELKVGDKSDLSKRKFLKTQVYKYTDLMKYYFAEETVYGFGAYQCITKNSLATCIKFVDYDTPNIPINHSEEIEVLKHKMKTECLN